MTGRVVNSVQPRSGMEPGLAAMPTGPLETIGIPLLLVWIFVFFSRILDVSFWYLKIPSILYALTLLLTLASGNALRLFSTRAGRLIALFTFWAGLAGVFGIWRTGSLPYISSAISALVLAVSVVALVATPTGLMRILKTLAFSSFVAALLAYPYGNTTEHVGRLALFQGTLRDPNQYAMTLLMGIPFWIMLLTHSSKFWKGLAILAIPIILVAFVRAGSRGGMLAAVALVGMMFLRGTMAERAFIGAGGLVLILLAMLLLPEYLRDRYLTFFTTSSSTAPEEDIQADANSAIARRNLFFASIEMTLRHPFSGVGPGNFAEEFFGLGKLKGTGAYYNVSHNSYTQASSETGIPGFLLFVGAIVSSFRTAGKIQKLKRAGAPIPQELLVAAKYTQYSMVAVFTCAAFLSMAYDPVFFVFIGISAVMERSIKYYAAQIRPIAAPMGVVAGGFSPTVPGIKR